MTQSLETSLYKTSAANPLITTASVATTVLSLPYNSIHELELLQNIVTSERMVVDIIFTLAHSMIKVHEAST